MNFLDLLPARVAVVVKALPTYLAVASMLLTFVADEVVPLLPENIAVQVLAYVTLIGTWIAAIVSTISRLTPATPEQRGLLPKPDVDTRADLPAPRDAGHIADGIVIGALASLVIVVLVLYAIGVIA